MTTDDPADYYHQELLLHNALQQRELVLKKFNVLGHSLERRRSSWSKA